MLEKSIVALVAAGAAALARHAPEIERAAANLWREGMRNGTVKEVLKCTDWKKMGDDVKETVKSAADYVTYKNENGGWEKKK